MEVLVFHLSCTSRKLSVIVSISSLEKPSSGRLSNLTVGTWPSCSRSPPSFLPQLSFPNPGPHCGWGEPERLGVGGAMCGYKPLARLPLRSICSSLQGTPLAAAVSSALLRGAARGVGFNAAVICAEPFQLPCLLAGPV